MLCSLCLQAPTLATMQRIPAHHCCLQPRCQQVVSMSGSEKLLHSKFAALFAQRSKVACPASKGSQDSRSSQEQARNSSISNGSPASNRAGSSRKPSNVVQLGQSTTPVLQPPPLSNSNMPAPPPSVSSNSSSSSTLPNGDGTSLSNSSSYDARVSSITGSMSSTGSIDASISSDSSSDISRRGGAAGFLKSLQDNNVFNVVWKRTLKELSSLPRAIAIMATIAGLSGLGTVIPQNKPYDYYFTNYPIEGDRVLGFLGWDVLFALQLDHIYSAWYFYAAIVLLAASLAACTTTRQLPMVKVAQRWRFITSPAALLKIGKAEALPNAHLMDLGLLLRDKGYQVFKKGPSLYAFKGLSGKLGPIGVHAALLLILFGTAYSGVGGFKGSTMTPEGSEFVISENIRGISPVALTPSGANSVVRVNKFDIDYRPDGSVAQFYTDLSLRDFDGTERLRKRISVNDPFRYGGVTLYQTDWSLAAITLKVLNADSPLAATSATDAFNLPLASLEGKPGVSGRLWATYLPLEEPKADGTAPTGVSILARDPQSVVFYDTKGTFVGVRRPGSGKPITVEGVQILVDAVIGSTGLELKSDPGVPWVYAGFGGLMITTLISYLSHSQIWALQQGQAVFVTGKTNRAKIGFEIELDAVLEAMPEQRPATVQQ